MARFQLLDKHYIYIVGVEWEYKEEAQGSVKGRNRVTRRSFPVPLYLDPKDESDCNYSNPFRIIVSTKEDRLYPDDYLLAEGFIPTHDMQPLDTEADEMIDVFRRSHTGEHPIESLSTTYGEQLLDKLSRQIESLGGREAHAAPAVSVNEFEKLKAENAALAAKVDEVLAKLAKQSERRI